VFANDLAVVGRLEIDAISFFDVDVQVIGPKTNHHLEELAFAVHRAQQRVPGHVASKNGLVILEAFPGGLLQFLEPSRAKITEIILDGFRVKLLIDPRGLTHLPDFLDVSRPLAVRRTV
jgi:hypothetical protein